MAAVSSQRRSVAVGPRGREGEETRFAGGYHEEMKTDRYRGYASSEGRLVVEEKERRRKIRTNKC